MKKKCIVQFTAHGRRMCHQPMCNPAVNSQAAFRTTNRGSLETDGPS